MDTFKSSIYPVRKREIINKINPNLEDLNIALKNLNSSINDMNETSQEIDEFWTKMETIIAQIENIQKRFVTRIGILNRNIKDVEEILWTI